MTSFAVPGSIEIASLRASEAWQDTGASFAVSPGLRGGSVPSASPSVEGGWGHGGLALAAAALAVVARGRGRRARAQNRKNEFRTARRAAVVFIDGEAGTTGLQVRERLERHPEIDLLSLAPELRKDEDARREALRSADAAVLCLPDDAARAAVKLADGSDTILVDASTAHRVSDGWVYGFPELVEGQREAIASSTRIANPGCYPTGFISLVRPLVDRGLLPRQTPLTVPAVSGYSGGGKPLINLYEGGAEHEPWGAYNLNLDHKHLAEMSHFTGLAEDPLFMPAVSNFLQGMVVSVPLRLAQLTPGTTPADVQKALHEHYAGQQFVSVAPLNPFDALERGTFMRPDVLKNTNQLELFVFANEAKGTLWLLARLDNLGKGASGACVQNLNIALGIDEAVGLA